MRGLNDEQKRMEVADVFVNGNFDVMGLCETKLKGNDQAEWDGVKVIASGRYSTKEGVALMMNEEWHACMTDFACVSSRCMWVKFKKKGVKVCVVVAYAPCEDRSEEMKENFWLELGGVVDQVPLSWDLMVIGDMNGRVGHERYGNVVGPHGVPNTNRNGKRLREFCEEKNLCITNTWFQHKNIHKCTWYKREVR